MPPKRKYPLPRPTPTYTSPEEGSGEDGSGIDFLQTTIVSTTVRLNTTTNMPTTVGTKKTEGTSQPSNPQTENTTGPSHKATTNMPINVSTEKQFAGSSATTPYPESSTEEEKNKKAIATTGTPTQSKNNINITVNGMDISVILSTSTLAATFKESTQPAQNYESTIEQLHMETKAKSTHDLLSNPTKTDMTTPYPGTNNEQKADTDIGNTLSSEINSKVTTVAISPSHSDTAEELNKEMITHSSATTESNEQPAANTEQTLLPTAQSNGVLTKQIFTTTKNTYFNIASSITGSTSKLYSLPDETNNVNTVIPTGTAKEEDTNGSKSTVPFSDKPNVSVGTTGVKPTVGTVGVSTDIASAIPTQLAQTSIILATDTNSHKTPTESKANALSLTTETPQTSQTVSTTQMPLKYSTTISRSTDITEKQTIPQSIAMTVATTIKEHLPTTDGNKNNAEQPSASTEQTLLSTAYQNNGVFIESIVTTAKSTNFDRVSSITGSTAKLFSQPYEADNINTLFATGTAKEDIDESKTNVPFSVKPTIGTVSVSTDIVSASPTQVAQTSMMFADNTPNDSHSTQFPTEPRANSLGLTTETTHISHTVSTFHTTQTPLKYSTNIPRSMDITEKQTIPQSITVTMATDNKEEHLPTATENRNNDGAVTNTFTTLSHSTSAEKDKSVSNIFTIAYTNSKEQTSAATEKMHTTHLTLTEQNALSTPSEQPTKEQSTQHHPDTTPLNESSSKPIITVASTVKTKQPYTVTTSSAHQTSTLETSFLRQTPDSPHITADDSLVQKETNTEHSDTSSSTTTDIIKVWPTTDNTNTDFVTSSIQGTLTTLKDFTESKIEYSTSTIPVTNTMQTTESTDKGQPPTIQEKPFPTVPRDTVESDNKNIATDVSKISTDTPTEVNSVIVPTEKSTADSVVVSGDTVNELPASSTPSSATSIERTTSTVQLQTTLPPKEEITKVSPVNEVTDVKKGVITLSPATYHSALSVDHNTSLSTEEANYITNAANTANTAETIKQQSDSAEKNSTISHTTMHMPDLQTSKLPLITTPGNETDLVPTMAETVTMHSTSPSLITTDISLKTTLTSDTYTSRQTVKLAETSHMSTTYNSDVSSTTTEDILKTAESISTDQSLLTVQEKLLTSKEVTESEIFKTETPIAIMSTEVPVEININLVTKETTAPNLNSVTKQTSKMTSIEATDKQQTTLLPKQSSTQVTAINEYANSSNDITFPLSSYTSLSDAHKTSLGEQTTEAANTVPTSKNPIEHIFNTSPVLDNTLTTVTTKRDILSTYHKEVNEITSTENHYTFNKTTEYLSSSEKEITERGSTHYHTTPSTIHLQTTENQGTPYIEGTTIVSQAPLEQTTTGLAEYKTSLHAVNTDLLIPTSISEAPKSSQTAKTSQITASDIVTIEADPATTSLSTSDVQQNRKTTQNMDIDKGITQTDVNIVSHITEITSEVPNASNTFMTASVRADSILLTTETFNEHQPHFTSVAATISTEQTQSTIPSKELSTSVLPVNNIKTSANYYTTSSTDQDTSLGLVTGQKDHLKDVDITDITKENTTPLNISPTELKQQTSHTPSKMEQSTGPLSTNKPVSMVISTIPVTSNDSATVTDNGNQQTTSLSEETSHVSTVSLSVINRELVTGTSDSKSQGTSIAMETMTAKSTFGFKATGSDHKNTDATMTVRKETTLAAENINDIFTSVLDKDAIANQLSAVTRNPEGNLPITSDDYKPLTTEAESQGKSVTPITVRPSSEVVTKRLSGPTTNIMTPGSSAFKMLDSIYTTDGSSDNLFSVLHATRPKDSYTGKIDAGDGQVTKGKIEATSFTTKGHLSNIIFGIGTSRMSTAIKENVSGHTSFTTLQNTVNAKHSPDFHIVAVVGGNIEVSDSSTQGLDTITGNTNQHANLNITTTTPLIKSSVTKRKHMNNVIESKFNNLHDPSFNFTVSTLKTPQDQSTADSSVKHTTQSPGLQETGAQQKSTPMGPTKHTPRNSESDLTTASSNSSPDKDGKTSPRIQTTDRSTINKNEYSTTSAPLSTLDPNENQSQTNHPMALTDVAESTNPTTRNVKDTTENVAIRTTAPAKPDQFGKMTTRQPNMGQTTGQPGQRPVPGEVLIYETTTKQVPNTKPSKPHQNATPTPNHSYRDSFTTMPLNEDDIEAGKATTPHTIHPHHICNMIKDEATKLRIPESDLKHIIEICAEMEQKYPNVNIPTPQPRQPNTDDREIPPRYPVSEGTPSIWYQQPGLRIIQILEEIYGRMNTSPTTNLTGIPNPNTQKMTAWLLLINKIKRATDPQLNLCIGPPADGMTTLQNGSMVVFRGNYFWTINQGGIAGMPRKISEVWGIPSPIDTVFTRCNCGGKTFFFKGPLYWRFTNDVMDKGYPKEIIKGFGGLRGKVTAVLSVAKIKTRPESVYFFKPGGNVQKYTFRQEQTKRCTKKKQPSINYPVYSQKVQTVRFRFPRDIVRHRIEIRRTFTNIPQPLGFLHEEKTIRSTWRGIPSNIVSAVSLPNPLKQDGFDYFVFTKDKYYNINMSSKVAIKPPAQAEQQTTKDWYKCKE